MFGNVKELYKMHKPFAEALQHAIKNWYPYRRMGVLFMDVVRLLPLPLPSHRLDCLAQRSSILATHLTHIVTQLLRMNGFLVEYGKYVNGYGTAIKYWNQAMRNPSFARFINVRLSLSLSRERESCDYHDLEPQHAMGLIASCFGSHRRRWTIRDVHTSTSVLSSSYTPTPLVSQAQCKLSVANVVRLHRIRCKECPDTPCCCGYTLHALSLV
jgi:hypothetical protein